MFAKTVPEIMENIDSLQVRCAFSFFSIVILRLLTSLSVPRTEMRWLKISIRWRKSADSRLVNIITVGW